MELTPEQLVKILPVLDKETRERRDKAVAEGYKDEKCDECGTVLLAHHSFIRCGSDTCPMKIREPDGSTKSLLDLITEDDKIEPGPV